MCYVNTVAVRKIPGDLVKHCVRQRTFNQKEHLRAYATVQ